MMRCLSYPDVRVLSFGLRHFGYREGGDLDGSEGGHRALIRAMSAGA